MDSSEVATLGGIDDKRFVDLFSRALSAVRKAEQGTADDRWAGAAQQVCGLLTFVTGTEQLWMGLHEATDSLEGSLDEVRQTRQMLEQFVDAEYVLLVRRGLRDDAAGQIVNSVVLGLMSFERPTHDEIDQLRAALLNLTGDLCAGVDDWTQFAKPERRARRQVNTIAVLGSTGGILGAASNAAALLVPPLLAGSIAGGMSAGLGALLGYRRRRG